MARRRATADNLSDTGTSTVANRRSAEARRQAEARATRDAIVAETKADLEATATRLENKPTDTRTISK